MVESDVCMVNKRMIFFTKRLRPAFAEALRAGRSKASSAAPLPPVQFADRQGIGFISCQLFIVTQSHWGEEIMFLRRKLETERKTEFWRVLSEAGNV